MSKPLTRFKNLSRRVFSGLVSHSRLILLILRGKTDGRFSLGKYMIGWPGHEDTFSVPYFFVTEIPVDRVLFPSGIPNRGPVSIENSVQWMEFRNLEEQAENFDDEYRRMLAILGSSKAEIENSQRRSRFLLSQAEQGVLKLELAGRFAPGGKFLLADGGHRLVASVLVQQVKSARAVVFL